MLRIGQRLREARMQRGLSIDDVSRETKIRPSFLHAIEKGEYGELPSSAYASGFVANYAQYLGFSKKEALALFRREFDEEKIFKVLPESLTEKKNVPLQKMKIQYTIFIVLGILCMVGAYLMFQYRYAFINPPLSVESPKEGAVTGQEVQIRGRTDSNSTVYVNNYLVALNSDGEFSKSLLVFPGKTTITVTAESKFGKQTVIERTINVKGSQ